MKHTSVLTAILGSTLLLSLTANAEEKFEDIIQRITTLKAEGKYSEALNELTWANKELQKLHQQKIQSFFPVATAGFNPGEFEQNSALGIMNVKRSYTGPNNAEISFNITGSASSEGGAAQGFGALAALAQMGAMMDNSGKTDTVRVNGKRATITNQGGSPQLMVTMGNGLMLQVESNKGSVTKEQLTQLAEAFNFKGFEAYMNAGQ